MYFGGSSFAAAPFGSSGGISIRAAVTGSRVNLATSDVLIRKWDGIVPGVSMTWDSSTFPEKRT